MWGYISLWMCNLLRRDGQLKLKPKYLTSFTEVRKLTC